MQFRRSGQGDERRRRVFRDEMLAPTDQNGKESAESRRARDEADGRVYSDAALAQRQAPLTSLLPQRVPTFLALFLGGGLAITGIEFLYARFFVGLPEPFQTALAVFDLTARGNIADWFASLIFVVAAIASTLIYAIRRHRLDDYRGRYRVWQWAAVCFVIGSFDAATGAHAILRPAMIQLTGTTWIGDGAVWSVLLVGLALASCLIRLAIEVRAARLALAFLCLSAGAYIGFVVVTFHSQLAMPEQVRVIAGSATLLAGHFCLLYSLALYGRYVYQEAQGTRRAGRAKPVVSSPSEAEQGDGVKRRRKSANKSKTLRVDATHKKPTTESVPENVPTISKKSVQTTAASSSGDASGEEGRPMSKAERRRLRKLERRQQRQAANRNE